MTRDRTPTLVASVTDNAGLDATDIRLSVDGRRVPAFDYAPGSGTLSYTCPSLKLGWHTAEITATDKQGQGATKSWRFRVVRR